MTTWRKASSCHANGTCVEVAAIRHPLMRWIAVRDAKNPDGHQLAILYTDWAAFTRSLKATS